MSMGWNIGLKRYPTDANSSWPLKVPAEVAAWRLREMHYSTLSVVHGGMLSSTYFSRMHQYFMEI